MIQTKSGPLVAQWSEKPLQLEWHNEWSEEVSAALKALPDDDLMPIDIVKALWDFGAGSGRQSIAIVRADGGKPVGVIPLRKRGTFSWQFLTQFVMPYARFHVLPEYTDAALAALDRYIACDNVAFYQLPASMEMLSPETTWVVPLSFTYDELMKRTRYISEDRRCRKRASHLDLYEDRYEDIPIALNHWAAKWAALGHRYTADRKDEMLLVLRMLAERGQLKSVSLYDGSQFASMAISVVGRSVVFGHVMITLDEYRRASPGIRGVLALLEWACAKGIAEFDMLPTSGNYKRAWAEPVVRSYRLVHGPFGSQALGDKLELVGQGMESVRWKLGLRR